MIGIAGPVFGGTLSYIFNIRHWCPISESEVKEKTGLQNVTLLNDFVANGYGVIGLKPEEVSYIYKPEAVEWFDDDVKLVLGIGTGFGGCQLTRAPPTSKGHLGNYHVNSSEPGMTRLTLYTEEDRMFEEWIRKEKGVLDRDDA